jgi:hypothetical protein
VENGNGDIDMRNWSDLKRFHWIVLLIGMAAASVSIAWNSYELITLSMANVRFLETHGLLAVMEGGLVQFLVISAKGFVALLSYLLFKGIEDELMQRWRGRSRRD